MIKSQLLYQLSYTPGALRQIAVSVDQETAIIRKIRRTATAAARYLTLPAALRSIARHLVEGEEELFGTEGLGDEVVHTGFEAAFAVGVVGVGGHRDDVRLASEG